MLEKELEEFEEQRIKDALNQKNKDIQKET